VSWGPLAGVLVAVLIFPTGLALLAEDEASPEADDDDNHGRRRAWGVAALAAGVAGLGLAGIGQYQAIIVAVALAVLVALIASKTSHDVVLVLVVIALIWSMEPEVGPVQPDPEPEETERTIVALGDSYMSGEGANVYYRDTNHNHGADDRNECRRAPTAYAPVAQGLLAERDEDYELLFLACSGAKADHVTHDAQYSGEPTSPWSNRGGPRSDDDDGQAQLPQAVAAINGLGLDPAVVLISIGGNDAGFGEVGQTCALAGDCTVLGEAWLNELHSFGDDLQRTYESIRDTPELAGARFIVVPYPVPLNESGCHQSLLRPDEHRFLVGFTRAIDQVLEERARAVGFEFLDGAVDVFTRHRRRICDVKPADAAVNQLAASPVAGVFLQQVSPRTWFHNTFHPNDRGHRLLATLVADRIEDGPPTTVPDAPDARLTFARIMGVGFDHCLSPDRVPSTCYSGREAWMVGAMTRLLWSMLVPVLLIVLGAFLLSTEAMRRWRRATKVYEEELRAFTSPVPADPS
jgi:lysophospholipase L1-like esterase